MTRDLSRKSLTSSHKMSEQGDSFFQPCSFIPVCLSIRDFRVEKQPETIHFLFIPFVVCLLIRFLPLSLIFIFFSLSSLRLYLLISSKSDASRYSSSCMISKARPYLREKKDYVLSFKVHILMTNPLDGRNTKKLKNQNC